MVLLLAFVVGLSRCPSGASTVRAANFRFLSFSFFFILLPFWLTKYQIAKLFGCQVSTITGNIRSILKTGAFREEKVMRWYDRGGTITELYNLEMITALAFRIHSQGADILREWMMKCAVNRSAVWLLPQTNVILN